MKIEKLNENQLRFTLTRADLEERKIRLSELAYGSEKARSLFREMMQQAADNFDFEVNNTPLMIEAIPISADSIILIVTKVDDPDELDSRYARFSAEDNALGRDASSQDAPSGADDILDLIARLSQVRKEAAARRQKEKERKENAGKQESGDSDVPAQSASEPSGVSAALEPASAAFELPAAEESSLPQLARRAAVITSASASAKNFFIN